MQFFHEPHCIFMLGNSFIFDHPFTPSFATPTLAISWVLAPCPSILQIGIQAAAVIIHPRSMSMSMPMLCSSITRKMKGAIHANPLSLLAYLRECAIILLWIKELSCLLFFFLRSTTPFFLKETKTGTLLKISSRLGPPAQGAHATCTRRGIDETSCSWQSRRSLRRFDCSRQAGTLDPIQSALGLVRPRSYPMVQCMSKEITRACELQVTEKHFLVA